MTKPRGLCSQLDAMWAEATSRRGQKYNAIALPVIFGELSRELWRVGEKAWLNAEPLAYKSGQFNIYPKMFFQINIRPRGQSFGWHRLEPEIWLINVFLNTKTATKEEIRSNQVKSSLLSPVLPKKRKEKTKKKSGFILEIKQQK